MKVVIIFVSILMFSMPALSCPRDCNSYTTLEIQKLIDNDLGIDALQVINGYKNNKSLSADIMVWAGDRFHDGKLVTRDDVAAHYWWSMAAEIDNAEANYRMGLAYEKGYGVDVNPIVSGSYYKKAYELGNAKAEIKWSVIVLLNQGVGSLDDEKKALIVLKKASETDQEAMGALGDLYQYGYWVGKNESKALEYFELAAARGHLESAKKAGLMLIQGAVDLPRLSKGLEYIKQCKDVDYDCALIIGKYYESGIAIERDRTLALRAYQYAAEGGNAEAMASLNRLNRHFKSPELFGIKIYGSTQQEVSEKLKSQGVKNIDSKTNETIWDSTSIIPGSSVLGIKSIGGSVNFIAEILYRFRNEDIASGAVKTDELIKILDSKYVRSDLNKPNKTKGSLKDLMNGGMPASLFYDNRNNIIGRWVVDGIGIILRRERDSSITLQYRIEPFFSNLIEIKSNQTKKLSIKGL